MKRIGDQGEELVAQQLADRGFCILARNYRKQYGEIDIVASRGNTLAFVEVKVRAPSAFGFGHLVPIGKQRKISMVAREYLGQHNITDKVCQFDVALLEYRSGHLSLYEYVDNAFVCAD